MAGRLGLGELTPRTAAWLRASRRKTYPGPVGCAHIFGVGVGPPGRMLERMTKDTDSLLHGSPKHSVSQFLTRHACAWVTCCLSCCHSAVGKASPVTSELADEWC